MQGAKAQDAETIESGKVSKTKSRKFNSSRQANSNINANLLIPAPQKTPLNAQLSTAVTSGSQKNIVSQHPVLAISKKALNQTITHK